MSLAKHYWVDESDPANPVIKHVDNEWPGPTVPLLTLTKAKGEAIAGLRRRISEAREAILRINAIGVRDFDE